MKRRPLYFLTIGLLLLAAGAGLVANRSASQAATSAARAMSVSRMEVREVLLAESRHHIQSHDRILTISIVVLLTAVGTWLWSRRRCEQGLQSVPLVLAVVAILSQLLLA